MKEIPMLFNGDMVRALLEGRKTQTRRILKPQPVFEGIETFGQSWKWRRGKDWFSGVTTEQLLGEAGLLHKTRTPQPPFRIWCRETFGYSTNVNNYKDWPDCPHISREDPRVPVDNKIGFDALIYRATAPDGWEWWDEDGGRSDSSCWKPSIFMPRWASRINLLCSAVWVERLWDISEEGAKAEGVTPDEPGGTYVGNSGPHTSAYSALWESINGKGSWAANPFVTVYKFTVEK